MNDHLPHKHITTTIMVIIAIVLGIVLCTLHFGGLTTDNPSKDALDPNSELMQEFLHK